MVSTFDEFQATMVEYPIDIMTMSETWLKNNPHLIDVTTPGCNCLFCNRDAIRGCDVDVHIRDHIKYERRSADKNKEPNLNICGKRYQVTINTVNYYLAPFIDQNVFLTTKHGWSNLKISSPT